MIKITHAVLDVADCNLTLGAFHGAPAAPLRLFNAIDYHALHDRVEEERPPYEDISGKRGAILRQLFPVYSENRFWRTYFSSRDVGSYARQAWDKFVPIAAKWTERVILSLPDGLSLNVSPLPAVLLYPFGWANWLSFRVTGDYRLEDLAALVRHLITGPAFRIESNQEKVMDLGTLFDFVSQGVRKDAFDFKANVRTPQSFLSVTTVLAKDGGAPSLGALTPEQELALKLIVRPGTPKPATVGSMASGLRYGQHPDLDYVVHDGTSWFIWADHKLWPGERNFTQLRCYHNNTFRSLQQAWMIENLFKEAVATKSWSAVMSEVIANALALVKSSSGVGEYHNASVRDFLERPELQAIVKEAKERLTRAHSSNRK